jgi:hypothetical protein
MQKVEGSSPFSRSSEGPASAGLSSLQGLWTQDRDDTADQLGGPNCVRHSSGSYPSARVFDWSMRIDEPVDWPALAVAVTACEAGLLVRYLGLVL